MSLLAQVLIAWPMCAQLVHANANAVSRQLRQTRDAQSATQCTSNPYLITGCDKHAPSHVARHSYSTAAEPAVFWLKSANDVELAALVPAHQSLHGQAALVTASCPRKYPRTLEARRRQMNPRPVAWRCHADEPTH